ncbi:uncharacterized protein LOC113465216 isoform X1 [Ceratina calcarata]|uniref:Uncharacterized protein LOC113465216 isoform X1 n=1 Tax=Ceratina calcarata TaxID=156304 RepID=A0AAJ7SDB1_9HYME|nr:uncharacterized protein LOC113465216 isoform X1 [Ceratina calcarata]
MRKLLLFVAILQFFNPAESVNGVIWDKKIEDFVPIFSVSAFALAKQDVLMRSRKEETHNFQGRIVRFTYFEEWNIVNSKNNGTEVTGVIGEIWNTLSEYLNFTLKLIKSDHTALGIRDVNNTYKFGLLNVIQRNGTDVLPRVEIVDGFRARIMQITVPLSKTGHKFYIHQKVTHVYTWMLNLFTPKTWYAVLIMYILFSVCNYLSQRINVKFLRKKLRVKLQDSFFYNFGMICGQSYLPDGICRSSKIVELWLGLFSLLIRTAFGVLLIRFLTQTTFTIPFHDLRSLLENSQYNILTVNGSLPQLTLSAKALRVLPIEDILYEEVAKRHVIKSSIEEMYRTVCTSENYAMFEAIDIKQARGAHFCPLNPVGRNIIDNWIVSAIARNFRYKRTIDVAIIKFHEVGFIDALMKRFITFVDRIKEPPNIIEPINMEQIHLILLLFSNGFLLSFIVFLFEIIAFYCKVH